jgi:hypothetical protein
LYDYVLLSDWRQDFISKTDNIFSDIPVYEHLVKHYRKVPQLEREVARQMLLNPANEEIRQIYTGFQVSRKGLNLKRAKLNYPLELLNANNLNTVDDTHAYKKLAFLYRDPSVILLYVGRQWNESGLRSEQNVRRWVKLVSHTIQRGEVSQDKLLTEKGLRMKVEMLAFLEVEHSIKVEVPLSEFEKEKLTKMTASFRISHSLERKEPVKESLSKLGELFKGKLDNFDWWIIIVLMFLCRVC